MRDILFRGKQDYGRPWVYGGYFHCKKMPIHIIGDDVGGASVVPETISQYIGLEDKNDRRIFEGDIVAYCGADYQTAIVCYGLYNVNGENSAHSEHYGLFFRTIKIQGRKVLYPDTPVYCIDNKAAFWPSCCAVSPLGIPRLLVEIIGNIHDNPELLEALSA